MPRKVRSSDDDEANRLLRRPYRQPWVHPEVETALSRQANEYRYESSEP